MPRIYASNSDPVDYCYGCFPGPEEGKRYHGRAGDGPDGRGNCYEYEADHPDYDGEDYVCHLCREPLTSFDN